MVIGEPTSKKLYRSTFPRTELVVTVFAVPQWRLLARWSINHRSGGGDVAPPTIAVVFRQFSPCLSRCAPCGRLVMIYDPSVVRLPRRPAPRPTSRNRSPPIVRGTRTGFCIVRGPRLACVTFAIQQGKPKCWNVDQSEERRVG